MRALIAVKAQLALHANTALPLAGQVSATDAAEFFDSDAFKDHVKHLEFKDKARVALFERFDGVLKAMGGLGKLLSRRR